MKYEPQGRIKTVNCTGFWYIIHDEDSVPMTQYAPCEGYYHVICTNYFGYKCFLVRVNGEWYDLDLDSESHAAMCALFCMAN